MPDASDPRGRTPYGWGDAFAALPPETPPADAWPRLSARLDARARGSGRRSVARTAGWFGAATAAALALVVAWPRHEAPAVVAAPSQAATPATASAAHATPLEAKPGTTLAANTRKVDATAIALPKAVEAARKPRLAARDAPARKRAPKSAAPEGAAPAATRLESLYAESARLEALLALARDDRVASASAALLASALDAQVAGIDASLAQPGLDDAQRTVLWQARVDALRQAAGFESTQRVLASQGNGGALLVSVD